MRRFCTWLAFLVCVVALLPANLWADAIAAAKGTNDGPYTGTDLFLGLAATGDTCAHTRAGAVVDAPFAGKIGAAAPGVACTIPITAGQLAGSTFTGLGNLTVSKFPTPPPLPARPGFMVPAVPVTSASASAGPTIVGPPLSSASAFADWASARSFANDFATQSAFVLSSTARGGQLALGAANSIDPWIFSSPNPIDITVFATLSDAEVFASADPDEFAYAFLGLKVGFGLGSQPGLNPIATWSFAWEAFGTGSMPMPFPIPSGVLVSQPFSLLANTNYWLMEELTAVSMTDSTSASVPEPASISLFVSGLLGFVSTRRKVRVYVLGKVNRSSGRTRKH